MTLRVLHCIHSLSGGGAERQVQLLAAASRRAGMEAGIFCVNERGGETLGQTVPIFKSRRAVKYNLSLFGSLHEVLRDFRPHVLHAWLPASMTIPAMLMAGWHRVPTVFSYRNRMFFNRPITVPEYVCAALLASKVVSNNPVRQSASAYRWLYRLKQGVEIKNAVYIEAEFKKPLISAAPSSVRTILFAGRLTTQKNWGCVLRSLPLLKTDQAYRLMVCGDGEDAAAVRALIEELHLQNKVELLGYRRDLYAVMSRADVFVLPSWYEGMPNVLLEALAIGVPSIVSDIPAHRDLVGDTGCAMTFDPKSPAELAARLDDLLAHSGRAAAMMRAGWSVAEAHTPLSMAQRYREVYAGLVAGLSAASEAPPSASGSDVARRSRLG